LFDDYSISKRLLTRFAESFLPNFSYWHFIIPTIYGENEERHRLIPYILDSLKENKQIKLTTGEQVRDYLYVEDIPKIISSTLEKKLPSGIYNLTNGNVLKVKEIVKLLFSKLGLTLDPGIFSLADRIDVTMNCLKLDGNKLNKYINNYSYTSLDDVLTKYIEKWQLKIK
jgi:nucleoside-diphosphate-sugar epimerase